MIPGGRCESAAKGTCQQGEKVKIGIESQARDKVTMPI